MTTRLKLTRPRLAALLTSVCLVAAAAVAGTASPAQAAGSCNLVAPARWTVSSPLRSTDLTVAPGCGAQPDGAALWEAGSPDNGVIVFGTDPITWTVDDDFTRLGVWSWKGIGCWAEMPPLTSTFPLSDCTQNAPKTDVRLGGWAGLTAVRTGSYVTVSTSSARYAYSLNKFVPWGGIRGTVQTRTSSTSPWVSLKWVYPGSTGKSSFRYATSSARDYRVVFPAASLIWGATSNVVRR